MRNEIAVAKMKLYCDKILAYCDGCSYEEFSSDMMLVEACVFNLSQIGELCRAVDEDYMMSHPEIPWKEMYGLRNRIVHDYEGVNLKLVWEIISDDIPSLRDAVAKIL